MFTFNRRRSSLAMLVSAAMAASGCGGDDAAAPGGLPSDKQVVADVTPKNDADVLDVSVTKKGRGEPYLHKNDLNWYWDRGVVVRRKAAVAGAPDAVVAVGGLARYVLVGEEYRYHRFLTTYNEYEGIPAPKTKALTQFVHANLGKVFEGREHRIVGIESVAPQDDASWVWHTATSFTVPFVARYDYVSNDTTVETRLDVIDIRFYRDTVERPVTNLLATERSRETVSQRELGAERIRALKTLRDGLPVGG